MKLVKDVDELVFDQYDWMDSDDEDDFGFGGQHLRDLVSVELWQLFLEELLVATLGYPDRGGRGTQPGRDGPDG